MAVASQPESKEDKEKEGDNGFPVFSDLGVPTSTSHYEVSQCMCTCHVHTVNSTIILYM